MNHQLIALFRFVSPQVAGMPKQIVAGPKIFFRSLGAQKIYY